MDLKSCEDGVYWLLTEKSGFKNEGRLRGNAQTLKNYYSRPFFAFMRLSFLQLT